VIVAASVAGCVSAVPRSEPERAADAALVASVEATLNSDPRIYARHVEVRADGSVIHLAGFLWTTEDLLIARNDAASVPGVASVIEQIELMRGGMNGTSR
jgi:osmotically-inducible protein OsmY